MTSEVHDLTLYDGLSDLNNFFGDYERWVPECQRFLAVGQALRATPARRWGTHKKNIGDWKKCRRLMWVRFGQVEIDLTHKYDGKNDPRDHIYLVWKLGEEFHEKDGCMASSIPCRQSLRIGI